MKVKTKINKTKKIVKKKITLEDLSLKFDKQFEFLGTKIGKVESKLGNRIDEVESKLGNRIDEVESKLGNRIEEVLSVVEKLAISTQKQFEVVFDKIDEVKTDLREFKQETSYNFLKVEAELGKNQGQFNEVGDRFDRQDDKIIMVAGYGREIRGLENRVKVLEDK